MGLLADLGTLYHLAVKPVRGSSHAERLESFYAGQATQYDRFRQRLLQGRGELWDALPTPSDGVWVDMGGGTGQNLEYLGDRIRSLRKVYLVDLCPSLLEIARRRIDRHGWTNVEVVEADVTTFRAGGEPVDVITFSYSLTMIPDWFTALGQAHSLLRAGGTIGVVDFYVSRQLPAAGRRRHGWWTRTLWPIWFARDHVHLSPDHVPYLHARFDPVRFREHVARVPYLPLARVPYYTFIGRVGSPNPF